MAGYYCKICGVEKYVDLDKEDVSERAIENQLCTKCQKSDDAQRWVDNNPKEVDL